MVLRGAFGFATLSFIAAIFAALSAALLFVRGVIDGAATLLGLGLGLSGFAGEAEREVLADLVTPLVFTPLEFVSAARRTDVGRVPATDAGRGRLFGPELEGVRVSGGVWCRTDYIVRTCPSKNTENSQLEGGGALSFMARSAALLFVLGATVGAFVLATEIVSLRLWPGTPSKVPWVTDLVRAAVSLVVLLIGFGGGCCPSLREAARVIRGATTGGAVDATTIVPVRLCPGTLAKVFAKASLLSGRRGPEGFCSTGTPARREAAFVVRGTMSGLMCVEGRGLALNEGRDRLESPTVDGFVAVDWADSRSARRTEELTDRMEPLSGRSETGKGGEEAKREAIWISAVSLSGEPMSAF